MSVLNKPYELSVWLDNQDLHSEQDFTETRICTIGAHDMVSQSRALNPKLVKNVNGSNTFSFTIYYRYKDNITGEEVANPFAQYLTNERKLKLKYDDEWYDFIIKSVKIDSSKYTYDITATDQHINELSKNGFNKTFDAELKNNVGTIQTLGQRVLEDTDWEVPDVLTQQLVPTGSEFVPDLAKEALLVLKLDETIDVTQIIEHEGLAPTTDSAQISSGSTIYAFYSCCRDCPDRFQFIYIPSDTEITKDDERIITNKNCQYYIDGQIDEYVEYINGIKIPSFCDNEEPFTISEEYRGARYVYSPDTMFQPLLNTYVTVYERREGSGSEARLVPYYGFAKTEYKAPQFIQNWVSNANTYKSTAGWSVGLSQSGTREELENEFIRINTQTNPPTIVTLMEDVKDGDVSDLDRYTSTLHWPGGTDNLLINSGLYDNRTRIGNLVPGTQYVVKFKLNGTSGVTNATLCGGWYPYDVTNHIYDLNNNDRREMFAPLQFSCSAGQTYTTVVTITNDFYTEGKFKRQTDGKIIFAFKDLSECYIEDFQFYEAVSDGEGGWLAPEDTPAKAQIITTKYFYNKADIDYATATETIDDFIPIQCLEGSALDQQFTTNISCEKRRSVTAKESNYFNIIQTLCENFECWAEFRIDHDAEGHITHKVIYFHNYVGQDNYAGFRYGVNLKSVSRTDDSKQIVTKLIVKQNANEFGENGFCTIARAPSNESGETYLFNFDYYVKQGLINIEFLNVLLYESFYPFLREKNDNLQVINISLANKALVLAQAEAELALYENGLAAATESLEEAAESFKKFFGKEWTQASQVNQDQLNDSRNISYLITCLEQDQAVRNYTKLLDTPDTGARARYEALKEEYDYLLSSQEDAINAKAEAIQDFYTAMSRYIQEGTWQSEDYYDDEKYYLDAQSTLYNSCVPKVSYSMSVLELSQLSGYEPFNFRLGDRTFVEDPEFFGYDDDGAPVREQVVLTEITYNLDQPEKNLIKIQNYKSQFQDLFKKITATVQSVQYSTGAYEKAAELAAATDSQKAQYLQGALLDAGTILENMAEQTVRIDSSGLTITDGIETNKALRAVSGGILLTEDGGNTWKTGITAKGVSASVLTSGILNTGEVNIMYGQEPTFRWDAFGLTAYGFTESSGLISSIDPTSGVRFDRLGIYGFTGAPGNWHPSKVVEWELNSTSTLPPVPSTSTSNIRQYSIFELTKEGLYLDLGRGRTMYDFGRDISGVYGSLGDPIQHETYAELGKVEDVIYSKWDQSNPYYDSTESATFVKVMAVGQWSTGTSGREHNENFVLYDDGTVRAKKLFVTDGIAFDNGEGLIKFAYHEAANNIAKPTQSWSEIPQTGSTVWHRTQTGADIYRSTTADGGATWSEPERLIQVEHDLDLTGDFQFFYDRDDKRRTTSIGVTASDGWTSYQWWWWNPDHSPSAGWEEIDASAQQPHRSITLNLGTLDQETWGTFNTAPDKLQIKCTATVSGITQTDYFYSYKVKDGEDNWGCYCTNPHCSFNATNASLSKEGNEYIEFYVTKGARQFTYVQSAPIPGHTYNYDCYTLLLSSAYAGCLSFSVNSTGKITVHAADGQALPSAASITVTITPFLANQVSPARESWEEIISWSFAYDGQEGAPLHTLSLSEDFITVGAGSSWTAGTWVTCGGIPVTVTAYYGTENINRRVDWQPDNISSTGYAVKATASQYNSSDAVDFSNNTNTYSVTRFKADPSYLYFELYKDGVVVAEASVTCSPNKQGKPGEVWDIEFGETGDSIAQNNDDSYPNTIITASAVKIYVQNDTQQREATNVYWKLNNEYNIGGSNSYSTIQLQPAHDGSNWVWQYRRLENNEWSSWYYVGSSGNHAIITPGKAILAAYTSNARTDGTYFDREDIDILRHGNAGTSPYSLSLNPDNFVIGVGSEVTGNTFPINGLYGKPFSIQAFYGNTPLTIGAQGASGTQYYITITPAVANAVSFTYPYPDASSYGYCNVTYFKPWASASATDFQDTSLNIVLYNSSNEILATAQFKVIPNKAGAPGESWDIIVSPDTIDQNNDGTYPTTIITTSSKITRNGAVVSPPLALYWGLRKAGTSEDAGFRTTSAYSSYCWSIQEVTTDSYKWCYGVSQPSTATTITAEPGEYLVYAYKNYDSSTQTYSNKFDEETITVHAHAQQGDPGAPGANGKSSEVKDIYYRTYNPSTSPTPTTPAAPTEWVTNTNYTSTSPAWTMYKYIAANATNTYKAIYHAVQSHTLNGDGTEKTGSFACTAPELIYAYWGNTNIDRTAAATFARLTNWGATDGISYDYDATEQKSKLYINASMINSGTLTVSDGTNTAFSATVNSSTVTIGGWTVNESRIYSDNGQSGSDIRYVGICSGKNGATNATYAFYAGATSYFATSPKFYVTSSGELHATLGNIAGWTISSNALYTGSNTSAIAPTLYVGTADILATTAIAGSSSKKNWRLKVSNLFGVDSDGNLYAAGGKIGAWNISGDSLHTSNNTYVYLSGSGDYTANKSSPIAKAMGLYTSGSTAQVVNNLCMRIGRNGSEAVFGIGTDGKIYATAGYVGGWRVDPAGLYITAADIIEDESQQPDSFKTYSHLQPGAGLWKLDFTTAEKNTLRTYLGITTNSILYTDMSDFAPALGTLSIHTGSELVPDAFNSRTYVTALAHILCRYAQSQFARQTTDNAYGCRIYNYQTTSTGRMEYGIAGGTVIDVLGYVNIVDRSISCRGTSSNSMSTGIKFRTNGEGEAGGNNSRPTYSILCYGFTCEGRATDPGHYASVSWSQFWAQIGNWASDRNKKQNITALANLPAYDLLFDALQPCRYQYKNGNSGRYHTGFIAQDIVQSLVDVGLTTQDLAAVCYDNTDPEDSYWYLRRDELIALNIDQTQRLKTRVLQLESRVHELEALLNEN